MSESDSAIGRKMDEAFGLQPMEKKTKDAPAPKPKEFPARALKQSFTPPA